MPKFAPCRVMKRANTRFRNFADSLYRATGDRAKLMADGKVLVLRNEFTPERRYCSIQDAIDHFSYLLGRIT